MSCPICDDTAKSRLLCPTCARNRLYPLRLETTVTLLEKESLGKQIEATVALGNPEKQHLEQPEDRSSRSNDRSHRKWYLQTISNKQAASSSRREDVSRNIEALKEEIRVKKADLVERKATLSRRRADAESAQYQLTEREKATLTGLHAASKNTERLWHSLHSKTAEARIFLCREVAILYGLRQRTTRKKDARRMYVLGGMPIVDLRDMNGFNHIETSTCFSNVARLLVIVSHYLSLRLPAEIILPHRDFPTMAIYPPASSYISRAMQDKNSSGSSASSQSSSKSKFKYTPPRPRPLFIDKPLQQLSKEDPATYALFLEGATLLAWDVAWLCRTQGININSDSWEEVCDIGKSMYQLLIAPPTQPSTLTKAMASRNPGSDSPTKGKSPTKDNPQPSSNNNQRTKLLPILGHYSHGTAHSSLAAFEGSEYMRSWKLPTPTKIVDKLKASLHGDMSNAEWELLEVNEWDDRPPGSDQTPSAEAAIQQPSTPTSSTTIRPNGGDNNEPSGQGVDDTPRSRGNSGWMKLNNR